VAFWTVSPVTRLAEVTFRPPAHPIACDTSVRIAYYMRGIPTARLLPIVIPATGLLGHAGRAGRERLAAEEAYNSAMVICSGRAEATRRK
jgi:hypothetical protein